jgi:excinuclease ABC subunit A
MFRLRQVYECSKDLIIPDMSKSLNEGAISVMGWNSAGSSRSTSHMLFVGLAEKYGFSMDTPVGELPNKILDIILNGSKGEKCPFTLNLYPVPAYTT